MAVTLYMRDETGPLGKMTVDSDGTVTECTEPALQALLNLAKTGGQDAASLDGYFNGYLMVSTDPAARWPEEEAVSE